MGLTTPVRAGVWILLILCVLHPKGTGVVQAGVTVPIQLHRSVPASPLSRGAGSGPPDMMLGGPQRGALFGGGGSPHTGTAFGLLWEGAIQSNPSSLSLFPQRFHRGFMMLTSFS